MKQLKFRSIGSRGSAHFILPLLGVVLVGTIGVYMSVASHADAVRNKSTYFLYSAGGHYPYVQVMSSKGFKTARCSTHDIGSGKFATLATPAKKGNSFPVMSMVCTTPPKVTDAYFITFQAAKPTGAPDMSRAVKVAQTTSSCVFIHAADAPNAQGVTHVLPRDSAGKCDAAASNESASEPPAGTPATPAPKKTVKKAAPKAKKASDNVTIDSSGHHKILNLLSPPNYSYDTHDSMGYPLLPASPNDSVYLIHTPTMPGGYSTGDSPASNRHGKKSIIDVFYTVAVAYHDEYSNSKLVAGDVNAPGHETHRNGIDMDMYSSDRSAGLISAKGGSDARSIELGKMLLDTGKIRVILFNDTSVQAVVNAYAANHKLPGRMVSSNGTHDFHFHVRVTDSPGQCTHGTAAECSNAATLFQDTL